jgi:capsid protein
MFHVDLICAAVNIPPNVAMSKYEDSFSASRMAGKDWEHTFMTDREKFSHQYLAPIYALQMYLLALTNEIQAPGLVESIRQNKEIVMNAYYYARWIGDKFPDIDPLKTANYLRKMLGASFDHMPLMTMEAAAEDAMQGNYSSIIKQATKEKETAAKLGLKPIEKPGTAPTEDDPEEEKDKK